MGQDVKRDLGLISGVTAKVNLDSQCFDVSFNELEMAVPFVDAMGLKAYEKFQKTGDTMELLAPSSEACFIFRDRILQTTEQFHKAAASSAVPTSMGATTKG